MVQYFSPPFLKGDCGGFFVIDRQRMPRPTGQSNLVLKLFVSYLRFEEIAQITGKSLSAVKMRIYRGLEKVKELMNE